MYTDVFMYVYIFIYIYIYIELFLFGSSAGLGRPDVSLNSAVPFREGDLLGLKMFKPFWTRLLDGQSVEIPSFLGIFGFSILYFRCLMIQVLTFGHPPIRPKFAQPAMLFWSLSSLKKKETTETADRVDSFPGCFSGHCLGC